MSELSQLLNDLKKIACPFKLQEPMKNYTSFRIGGDAECIIFPKTEKQLSQAMQFIKKAHIPVFFLGRGSNLLVRDAGVKGIVVHLNDDFGEPISIQNQTDIYCPSGKKLSELCKFAAINGLSGLEFAYGIPGSVGGGIYMNAGAYGGEIKDVLLYADYLDEDGSLKRLYANQLDLSYRHSIFCNDDMSKSCVIAGMFHLKLADKHDIQNKMDDISQRRKSKQPLDFPSAGSTFKRPEGAFAAALIEECGLKGYHHGGAMVSEKHSGFVINYDNASCEDVLKLVDEVREIVMSKTGFDLKLEIKIIGID